MEFFKYQGTGNDFILIDNRHLEFNKEEKYIEQLCHRRFGIGADGLILLENASDFDFRMIYYNSDGKESTMCGNGGRCIVAFAHFLKIFEKKTQFIAIDGAHQAEIDGDIVKLKMIDVEQINERENSFVLNTGSPHYVQFVSEVKNYDVYENGKKIRYSQEFSLEGINVNFVEKLSDKKLFVRTYERGVEDETLSCGTGITASALAFMKHQNIFSVEVEALGGKLKVYAEKKNDGFHHIWLEGAAQQVFKGNI